jgi:peptidoglycan biosynthesis protein MviN/MurJ (putative lipid II flippase)
MYASLASVALTIGLNVSLIGVLGFMIFPLSTSLAAGLNFWLLAKALPRKVGRIAWRPLVRYMLVLTAAALAGGAAGWAANNVLAERLAVTALGSGLLAAVVSLVVGGALGLIVFYGASRLLGITETRDFVRRFLKR